MHPARNACNLTAGFPERGLANVVDLEKSDATVTLTQVSKLKAVKVTGDSKLLHA